GAERQALQPRLLLRVRHVADVIGRHFSTQQIVEHRGPSAVLHLAVKGFEVRLALGWITNAIRIAIVCLERGPAAIAYSNGHRPSLVRAGNNAEPVGDLHLVNPFWLDGQSWLRDHRLDFPDDGLITAPNCLVEEHEDRPSEIRIEPAGELVLFVEVPEVRSEQLSEDAPHDALTAARKAGE